MRGDRLRQIRKIRGITQEELSERLGIGNRQIWRYENNKTVPDVNMLTKLADALDVSADYLLGLSDEMDLRRPIPTEGLEPIFERLQVIMLESIMELAKGDPSKIQEMIDELKKD
jgi:transcriptional regulator with XRE-family HTH domain